MSNPPSLHLIALGKAHLAAQSIRAVNERREAIQREAAAKAEQAAKPEPTPAVEPAKPQLLLAAPKPVLMIAAPAQPIALLPATVTPVAMWGWGAGANAAAAFNKSIGWDSVVAQARAYAKDQASV